MTKTITAIFDTRAESESALTRLERAGFTKDQVTILVSEETRGKHFGFDESPSVEKGMATGATIGGLVGALYLGLASAGTLMVPGLNIVVSGAFLGSLAGLGAGAVSGGLIGALVGLGVPEYQAKIYEAEVRKGAILVAVEADSDARADDAKKIMEDANAQGVTAVAA